jgi:hypothetical protein
MLVVGSFGKLDQNSLADLEKVLETKTKKDKQYMGKKT